MRFLNYLAFACIASALSGCAATPIVTGGGKSQGLVEMSVMHSTIAPPIFDWAAARKKASATCKNWGYQDAIPANGPEDYREGDTQECVSGTEALCAKRKVSRLYQCTG
ncbi:YecR family lipoprotein [Hoeflea poritis]|uniref:YecR family lipoprotein n=1 Tax=Hoeflea poritis TaxID=2993659 RepID=UPI003CCE0C18